MTKNDFRQRAYAAYSSGFKAQAGAVGNASDSPAALRYRRYVQARLRPWVAGISRDAVVADLGCGDGFVLRVFRELGFENLHGVEGSAEMASLCQQHFPTVVQGDLREFLRRHSLAFDIVVLFDVIEHFTREEAVDLLDEVSTSLRPGGHLLLQLPNGDSPFATAVFAGDITHESLYTRGSLSHLLAISGFELVAIEEHAPHPIDLRSSVRWAGWRILRSILALCHRFETGGISSGVYTRVMRAAARKL